MGKAKEILLVVTTTFAAGVILGALYAPEEGVETRRKLKRLKNKLTLCGREAVDSQRDNLEQISAILQKELKKINEHIERLS